MHRLGLSFSTPRIFKNFTSVFLVLILSFSFLINLLPAKQANAQATQQVTWTTKGDFENNAVTTGTPTTRTNVDTSNFPGGVKLNGISNKTMAVGSNTFNQTSVSSWTGITAIAAGYYHTVGLKSDGTVVAVGRSSEGQTSVSSWTGITAIAAGYYHTVGLKSDGTVVAVGSSGNGQTRVFPWTGITAIAAGGFHTVGLKSNGTVTAVGYDAQGQTSGVSYWTGITAIAAGGLHTVGLKSNGTVTAVGYSTSYDGGVVSYWTGITAIAAGYFHTVGLKSDGTVVAVGRSSEGQTSVSSWTGITAIAAGFYHTVGLKSGKPIEYYSPGTISGLKIDAGDGVKAKWNTISWNSAALPQNTAIKFRVRTSNDNSTWSGWSGYFTQNALSSAGSGDSAGMSASRYIEAELTLVSSDGLNTPTLNDFTVTYDEIPMDSLPPITTASLSGIQGDNGWYKSDVQINLSATDDQGGSGVAKTEYSLNNGISWQIGNSFTVSIEGINQILYRSTDNAGNVETQKSLQIKIDKSKPITTAILDGAHGQNSWFTSSVQVSLSAADSVSGIAEIKYSFDNINWQTYTDPISISVEGSTQLYYRSTDNAGNTEDTNLTTISIDKSYPITSVTLTGILGQNNWYITPVDVKLIPTDSISGILQTQYSLNNGTTWLSYTGIPITLSTDGATTILYKSTDYAGNEEISNTIQVPIDKSGPIILVQAPDQPNYLISEDITISYLITDDTSGVASSFATLDNQPVSNGQIIDLFSLPIGSHVFTVTAIDNAGNLSTKTITFDTISTPSSIISIISELLTIGQIDNSGVANSLIVKVKSEQFNAFINSVEAQAGKHISLEAATLLINAAQSIIDGL